MPHSYAAATAITCPNCHHKFTFDVWLILDAEERPDLLELVRAGTLHASTCPQCNETVDQVDEPLLLYQPDDTPSLLFFPARRTTPEQDQQQAIGLISRLKETLGADWQNAWLQDGLSVVRNDNTRTGNIQAIFKELNQPVRDTRDMPKRVELYLKLLELIPRKQDPPLWAVLQAGLAISLAQNPQGNRANNLEQAIQHYGLALEVYTRTDFPEQWAATQNNLANAYRDCILGNRADNLEQAIRHCSLALDVYTRTDFPEQWATTQNNLAIAYSDRILGIRADNLEQAIEHYTLALEVRIRDDFPADWATAQNNLARAYSDRILGNRADNLEQAIQHFALALEVFTRTDFPEQWAMTQNNLAIAYRNRILGGRVDNLEQAIQHYTLALDVLTRDNFPESWAMTQNNLAVAYSNRVLGSRADNLDQAIQHFTLILNVYTRADFPEQWATTQHNLAVAYSDRILGNRVDNLEQAIQHFALALEVFTRDDFPANWATTQNNLGTAHRNRILDSRADNLDQAIQHYSRALEVFSRNNFPEWWAMTQNNLAIAYSNRILGSRVDNLEQAIQHFTLALEVYTCNDFPERWAMIQNNLGTAYSDRIPGNRVDNLEQAIQHFTLALAVYTCNDFPVEYRRTQGNFGRAFLQQKDGQSAYVAFAEAISAAEMLFVGAGVPENQMHEVHENAALYDGIVTACIHLGSTQNEYARKALEYAEAGKARTFLDQMGQTDLPAPLDASTALMQEEQRLIDELRGITLAMLSSQGAQSAPEKQSDHPQDLQRTQALARSHRFHELRIELDTIWNRMLAEYPQANDYVTLRRGDAPAWNDLIELANEIDTQAAFVEFYSLEDEMVVFILHANCDQPKVLVLPLSREKLYYRYLLPYQQEVLNYAQHVNAGRRPTYSWLDLGTELLKPVQNYLEPEELVYFVPHGLLHVLPLHALLVDGAPFLQHHPIAYTPSLGVLTRVFQRQDHASAEFCPLVMGYAADDDAVKPYIETGTRNAAKVLGCTPLLGSQASRQALRDQAATATHLHLLCHGNFMPGTDALSSAVYLADGPFTAHDWMSVQTHADLVMLAACQTGMVDLNAGDELTGLVRSVLYAGASSVVATLWSVNADSTIRWTNEFYSHALANKQQPMSYAEAFRKATLSLYEQTDDPYFWAPFILVGDWR